MLASQPTAPLISAYFSSLCTIIAKSDNSDNKILRLVSVGNSFRSAVRFSFEGNRKRPSDDIGAVERSAVVRRPHKWVPVSSSLRTARKSRCSRAKPLSNGGPRMANGVRRVSVPVTWTWTRRFSATRCCCGAGACYAKRAAIDPVLRACLERPTLSHFVRAANETAKHNCVGTRANWHLRCGL